MFLAEFPGILNAEIPKRGRSKRGRTKKHTDARKQAQMSVNERKRKSAKGQSLRVQKSASAQKLQTTRFKTAGFGNSQWIEN